MNPVLSIVTGTLNRQASFERLVRSIQAHAAVSWELVVSDASEVPYSLDLPDNVKILPERPRQTCSKGYNNAFRRTGGEWVIWLNDDCEVVPGYDLEAIAFMKKHPEIGLGALHYSEGDKPFHVNSAWGAIYANFGIIRRRLGNQIGWFDEEISMYGVDNSITFRVLLEGYGVADIPEAKIIHHSEKDQTRADNQASRVKDNDTLHRKYFPLRDQWLATFTKFKLVSEMVAWSHGVRP